MRRMIKQSFLFSQQLLQYLACAHIPFLMRQAQQLPGTAACKQAVQQEPL